VSNTIDTPQNVPHPVTSMGTATYSSMVRFSEMVVTPLKITTHSAVRPRIVMLWVFFLVTVVVVGPTVPASAFVSCTWHHSQLPGERPETINGDATTSRTDVISVTRNRSQSDAWHSVAVTSGVPFTIQAPPPAGRFPTEVTLRGPPASV